MDLNKRTAIRILQIAFLFISTSYNSCIAQDGNQPPKENKLKLSNSKWLLTSMTFQGVTYDRADTLGLEFKFKRSGTLIIKDAPENYILKAGYAYNDSLKMSFFWQDSYKPTSFSETAYKRPFRLFLNSEGEFYLNNDTLSYLSEKAEVAVTFKRID